MYTYRQQFSHHPSDGICHPISSAAAVSLHTVYFWVSCFTLCPRLQTTHYVSSGMLSLTHSLLPVWYCSQCSVYSSNKISSEWYQALLLLPCCALYRKVTDARE